MSLSVILYLITLLTDRLLFPVLLTANVLPVAASPSAEVLEGH